MNRIAARRKELGISQQQLADRVGCHWVTISKLERGQMQLTEQWLKLLSRNMYVSKGWLLGEGEDGEFSSAALSAKEETRKDIADAVEYLTDGGLGEVLGLTQMAIDCDLPTVMSDAKMAMALCILAAEAVQARRDARETRQ